MVLDWIKCLDRLVSPKELAMVDRPVQIQQVQGERDESPDERFVCLKTLHTQGSTKNLFVWNDMNEVSGQGAARYPI